MTKKCLNTQLMDNDLHFAGVSGPRWSYVVHVHQSGNDRHCSKIRKIKVNHDFLE
jgi:hypothetical protein